MFKGRVLSQSFRAAAAPRAPLVSRASIRGYASPADAATKPPVALFGVDGTYASALYTASVKSSSLDATAKALESLHKTFISDPKLQSIMTAPSLTADDKASLCAELLKVSGAPQADKTMKNFLDTLAVNNRLSVLFGVCEKFAELMSAHRGEMEMRVTSATPLDAKIVKQLENAVGKSQYVGAGKKLKVVTKVQPDIRGGLVVEIGDRTIDLSVANKMARMSALLQESM